MTQLTINDVAVGDDLPVMAKNASRAQLFLYSAASFNPHRIHYDREYAREVEGYEGLVFHGPLTATLAYDFGFGPDTLSYVPIVFTLMLPIYAWLVLGEQIVEFTPLAYETVFQNMADPVFLG